MKFLNIPKALNSKKGEIKTIIILIVMAVIGLGILVGSQVRDGRINLLPRASESDTVKIMTFNLLGEPLCGPGVNHTERMQQITNFIKANNIKLAALQELKKTESDNCNFNLPEILNAQLKPPYFISTRQYLGSNDNKWFRMFVSSTPAVFPIVEYPPGVTWVQPPDSEGFEAIVLDTDVGRIRFINLHAEGKPILADNIIKFTDQFRSDGIPMILMGDFNLMYTYSNHPNQYNHAPILEKILQAGFYRACDPLKFPDGNCNDTVKSTSDTANYAIDHILIDTRAKFYVKNAYVEQSMRFSDHLPVIVELQAKPAGTGDQVQTNTSQESTSSQINIWDQIKPAPGNIYLWSNGGPTAGWESYLANFAYMCNGKYCWVFNRNTLTFNNNGNPIALDTDPGYSSLKAAPNGTLPWSNGGPTAAWTWILSMNGQTVNETMLCNGNYCWRYLRYPTATGSGWRENGSPIYLPTYNDVWKDTRVTPLWSGNGITAAWTDPINNRVTMCNHKDCRSIDYKTWTWRNDGASINSTPPGVTEVNSAWTSPTTNVISLCSRNVCSLYDIAAAQYKESTTLMSTVATATPIACPAGQLACVGNSCVDVTNNFQHCGACGRACAQGQVCSNRLCVVTTATRIPTATATRTPTPTPTRVLTCTDSDGGNKPDVAGTVNSTTGGVQTDSCSGSTLTEYYCSGTTPVRVTHNCAYGCGAFKCLPPPPTATPIANMGVPTLTSPINAVAITAPSVTLRWTAVTGATSYDWVLNRGSIGRFKTGTVTGTSAVVAIPPGSYTWQVTAKGTAGSRITGLAEFKRPFSKIKPLAGTQILYGSTHSFEWTPLLASDLTRMYLMIYSSTNATTPIYYKDLAPTSNEYLTGKVAIPLTSATNAGFAAGKSFTWQIVMSSAGAASQHVPPTDSTSTPQSFSLVTVVPTPTLTRTPIATATKIPVPTDRCNRKSQGDADCDGIIHLKDGICWVLEAQNKKPANCVSADFNGNGTVGTADLVEFGIWKTNYIKENTIGDSPANGGGRTQ